MSQLKIEGVFDPSGIEQGAKDADAAFEKLGGDVANAADRANAAMVKLGSSEVGARMAPQIAKAALAVEDLKTKIDAAKASGSPIPPEVEAQLRRLEAGLGTATTKLGRFKDEAGDVARRAQLAGQGFETMAGAGGSLQGMLGNLADTGGRTGSALAKAGLASAGLTAAFKVGWEIGQQFNTFLREHNVRLDEVISGTNRLTQAQDALGVVAQSVVGKQNRLRIALGEINDALAKADPQYAAIVKRQQEAARAGEAWAAVIQDLSGRKGVDLNKWIAEHAEALVALGKELREHPELWNKLALAVGETGVTLKTKLGGAIEAAEKLQAALAATKKEMEAFPKAEADAEAAIKALEDEFGNTEGVQKLRAELQGLKKDLEFRKASQEAGVNPEGEADRTRELNERAKAVKEAADAEKKARQEEKAAIEEIHGQYLQLESDQQKRLDGIHAEQAALSAINDVLGQAFAEQDSGARFRTLSEAVELVTDGLLDQTEAGHRVAEALREAASGAGLASGFFSQLANKMIDGKASAADITRELDQLVAGLRQTGSYTLFPNLDADVQKMKKALTGIRDIWTGEIVDTLKQVDEDVAKEWDYLAHTVEENMRHMADEAKSSLAEVKDVATDTASSVQESFDGMASGVAGSMQSAVSAIKRGANEIVNAMTDAAAKSGGAMGMSVTAGSYIGLVGEMGRKNP